MLIFFSKCLRFSQNFYFRSKFIFLVKIFDFFLVTVLKVFSLMTIFYLMLINRTKKSEKKSEKTDLEFGLNAPFATLDSVPKQWPCIYRYRILTANLAVVKCDFLKNRTFVENRTFGHKWKFYSKIEQILSLLVKMFKFTCFDIS